MAKNNLLKKFAKNILSEKKSTGLKGGRNYEPNLTGSTGWVNWDDVTVRNPNIIISTSKEGRFSSKLNG